jgi:hypothetical protein
MLNATHILSRLSIFFPIVDLEEARCPESPLHADSDMIPSTSVRTPNPKIQSEFRPGPSEISIIILVKFNS